MEQNTNRKKVAALGFFDGVHKGHGALLSMVARRAKELHAVPAAITFDTHPSRVLGQEPVPLLNTAEDRRYLMEEYYGIEEMVLAHFDKKMMSMPWQDFITEYLIKEQNVCHVVCGHDFRFGYKGQGDPEKLRSFCGELGIGCDVIGKVELEGVTVSSTHIRGLIAAGEMEEARRFLGHPHILSGEVVHGKALGRTIGIPTANLIIPQGVAVPAFGVYASRVTLGEETFLAVTNVGVRPTVDDGHQVTVEPWILDFDRDIYGQTLRLEFYRHLRGEKKFGGLEELRQEICRNAEETRTYFREKKERGSC